MKGLSFACLEMVTFTNGHCFGSWMATLAQLCLTFFRLMIQRPVETVGCNRETKVWSFGFFWPIAVRVETNPHKSCNCIQDQVQKQLQISICADFQVPTSSSSSQHVDPLPPFVPPAPAAPPARDVRAEALREAMQMARRLREFAEEHPAPEVHDQVPGITFWKVADWVEKLTMLTMLTIVIWRDQPRTKNQVQLP